ncbi:BGTF surface domain-containing protein [Haloarchaeobius sp. DFWS5]|uniref:DUF7827 domain-containing protein n=1 Tax=Haloarchaeobius sp. DFWS5 TaxID=3446114 RepID=UPI003EBEC885
MTGNKDKARSILLAALMVTSVFAGVIAFSGGAAAASVAPSVTGAVEYNDGGTSTIEIALSEASNASLAGDITIEKNGNNVTGDYTVAQDGQSGTIVLTASGENVNPTDDLTVTIDEADYTTGTYTLGDVSPTVTSYTVTAGNSGQTFYAGGKVAFVANNTDEGLDVTKDGSVIFNGSTGANSSLYVFNTANRNISSTYGFTTYESGSTTDTTFDLRELTLDASADDTSINTEQSLTVSVSENRGGAQVQGVLVNENDEAVATRTVTLDGSGDGSLNFGARAAGNFTVEVTDVQTGMSLTTETIEVSEASDEETSFAQDITSSDRGDIAEVTIDLQGTDSAFVTVGSEDAGYVANGTVTDVDDDGQVTLMINTYLMGSGTEAAGAYAAGDDQASGFENQPMSDLGDNLIDFGQYEMSVAPSEGADTQDVATLDINERSTNGLNVWTAPAGADADVESASDVQAAVDAGLITEDSSIALNSDTDAGDLLIHELDASGLEGVIAAQSGADSTAKFFNLIAGDNASLMVTQDNPGQNQQAKMLQLGADNTTVIADADNSTYYLITDSSSVNTDIRSLMNTDEYTATFVVNGSDDMDKPLAAEDEEVTAGFEFVNREASVDTENDMVNVAASDNQSVTGSSSLAAGSELNIRVNSEDADNPFLKTGTATVSADGTWEASMDFSDVPAGTNFSMTVRDTQDSNTQLASAEGQVGEADEEPGTTTPGTTTAGTTEEPTSEEPTTEEPTTEQPTTEEPTTEEPTTEGPGETTEGPGETTEEPSDDGSGQPGFGIGIALVALVGAALLAARRQD